MSKNKRFLGRFRDSYTQDDFTENQPRFLLQMNRAWVHASVALLRSELAPPHPPLCLGLTWRHHGLGMLQAELTDELRVHIWDPALVTMTEPFRNVHDHRFDLYSFVVVGSIQDRPYDVSSAKSLETDFNLHQLTRGNWQECVMWEVLHAKLQTPGFEHGAKNLGPHFAKRGMPRTYVQGETYAIPRRYFHTTNPTERAITLVYRTNFDAENARVLGVPGSEKLESGIVHHDALLTHKPCAEALEWAEGELRTFFDEFLVKEDPR